MNRAILPALILACGGTVWAAQWVAVPALDQGPATTFLDSSGVRAEGAIRRASFKFVFEPHTMRGNGDDAGKWQSYVVVRDAFICDGNAGRVEAEDIHFDDGTVSAVTPDYFPTRWRRVAPNSTIGRRLQYVCALQAK
jgi:hypothetical protein